MKQILAIALLTLSFGVLADDDCDRDILDCAFCEQKVLIDPARCDYMETNLLWSDNEEYKQCSS